MRTKHLLYTMALAGTFAACMQEEFVTVDSADALAGRKSIGKITFTEAPSTRWAVKNWDEIAPEDGDGFSLMLVDVPRQGLDGQHLYPIDNYELINKVQTNYIFKKNGSNWDSEAELVEGNYLYVAPAQEGKLDRNTVEITLPTEQNLSLGADGKLDPLSALKEFVEKKYPFYIGHRFLSEDGSINLPDMQHIFAYPEITVTNSDAFRDQTAILKKVIIKQEKADDAFVINAPLKADAVAKLLTNEYFEDRENTDTSKDKVVVGDWAGHMSQYFGVEGKEELMQVWKNDSENNEEIPATAIFEAHDLNGQVLEKYMYNKGLHGATSELLGAPQSKSQYIVINMPGDGIALKYGESIKFNAVIPAETYQFTTPNVDGLTIYAVLDNNEAYEKVVTSNISRINMYPGKRYPDQDYTGLEVKGQKGLYFTIDVCDGKTDGVSKYVKITEAEIGGVGTIDSTDDLIAAIKAHTSTENLNLTIEGRNVVYNEDVNKAVANTNCQNVTIQGNIKVIGGTSEALAINSRVVIEDAVIEEGKVAANKNSLKQVFVDPEAELTLNEVTDNVKGVATIYNTGVLTLRTKYFARVENYGKLKVGTDLSGATNIEIRYAACGEGGEIISPSIDLIPSVEVLAGGKYAISGDLDYEITVNAKTATDNAGVLMLSANTNIVKETKKFGKKELETFGNIINNGEVSGAGVLTVNAGRSMTVGADATVTNKVVISPATHKLESMIKGVEDYEPKAVVYNAGTLKGNVDVNGLLVMKTANARVKGEINFTADGNDEGEIDNTAKGVIEKTVPENVVVFATVNEINLDDHANTVKALKDYTTATRQVTVFRLIGEMKRVQNMTDNKPVFFKTEHVGETVTAIEFMPGSSITLGEVTVVSDMDFVARGYEIPVNGRTNATSILDAETKVDYSYLGEVNGIARSVEGSFDYNNATRQ